MVVKTGKNNKLRLSFIRFLRAGYLGGNKSKYYCEGKKVNGHPQVGTQVNSSLRHLIVTFSYFFCIKPRFK